MFTDTNRNKLRRSKNNTSVWIITGAVLIILTFFFMLYACYEYKVYMQINDPEKVGFEEMMSAVEFMFTSPSFELPITAELIKEIILMQFMKLWYVYLVIIAGLYLMATSKRDNDYRGVEHGSATWAGKYDEQEFKDSTGIPVGDDFYASITGGTKKNPAYKPHNLNEIVIGGSGAGKSFRKIKPDIMQMYGSYVITDPKGELYRDTAKMITENGYKIRVLNLIDINLSNTYNPFVYMTKEQDVLSIADLFMKNTAGEGEKEDFWSGSAQDLLVSVMLYLWKAEHEEKSFGRVIRLVNSIQYDNNGHIDELCEIARCMKKHAIENPYDAATINWKSIQGTPQETMGV